MEITMITDPNDDNILGYWIDRELVCKDCYDEERMGPATSEDVVTRWTYDPDILYICSVCKRRIV
jgi:hypothetical protein